MVMGGRMASGMLPAEQCIKGRATKIPNAPKQDAKHFIKGTPLYGPWDPKYKQAMIGMGCFWCSENLFMRMEGVYSTQVGYACGTTQNPTYEDVCTGATNHNEVCRIIYDPAVLPYREILKIFWMKHDPTTYCQQGGDRGTQYRSGIYYYDEEQKQIAEETKKEMQALINAEHSGKEISTEIIPAPPEEAFYIAEDYHQQYDAKPGSRQYCGLRPLRLKGKL